MEDISNFYFILLSDEIVEKEIPAEYVAECHKKKQELIESLSNVDEELGEMFLNEKTPTKEQIKVHILFFNFN